MASIKQKKRDKSDFQLSLMVDSRRVAITNPNTILFPADTITKRDLIDYYYRIRSVMTPYIAHYPLSMKRFPDGIESEGFFQKDTPAYFPDWIDRVPMPKKDGVSYHVLCHHPATLVYLANQAAIELHIALSREENVEIPTKMIFDLDPSVRNTRTMRYVARTLKLLLEDIGLYSYIMNTGSRGVHIIVLLTPEHTFEYVYSFAYDVARILVVQYPSIATLQLRKNKRGKKVFIDVLRNGYGATAIAPFSVRARKNAPVATPLSWDEFFKRPFNPQRYTISNIFRRLARIKDPWNTMESHRYSLKKPRTLLDRLVKGLE